MATRFSRNRAAGYAQRENTSNGVRGKGKTRFAFYRVARNPRRSPESHENAQGASRITGTLARMRESTFWRVGFVIALIALCAAIMLASRANAAADTYLGDLLGVTRAEFIGSLNDNSKAYLGTPYKSDWPAPTDYQTGPWYSKGYHPYEDSAWDGSSGYGMNCAGFIARVLCDQGAEKTAFMQKWYDLHQWKWANAESFYKTAIAMDVRHYDFTSKEAMLASGKLTKGDIVYIDPHDNANAHIGIFWGSTSSSDRFWHSIFYHDSTTDGENMISEIYGKVSTGTFTVFKFDEPGRLEIVKESASAKTSKNNPNYSLEGAKYTVYSDAECTEKVTVMSTDATGHAVSDAIDPGLYYIKETKPSPGFALDSHVYKKRVKSDEIVRVNTDTVEETPQVNPIDIVVAKYDAQKGYETSGNTAQGDATLAGAVFSVRFYAAESAAGIPKRTWTVTTDAAGHATIPGDELYANGAGDIGFPLGVVTVQEVQAPPGYLLNDQLFTIPIISSGKSETVNVYQAPHVDEGIIHGGVSIGKIDRETKTGTPLGDASLEGAAFDITNLSPAAVTVDGVSYAPGAVVKTITTVNGVASTANDCLPYGSYRISEKTPPTGYLPSNETRDFSIRENGKIVDLGSDNPFTEQVIRGGVSIEKLDGETMLNKAQGGASVDGAVFEITNISTHHVLVDGKDCAPQTVVCSITTKGGVAKTAANALPYGTYRIRETTPPPGYLPTSTTQTFSIRENGATIALTGTHTFANQIKRADIEFTKLEEGSMKHLGSVPFAITSQTTGERHMLVTDANGYASTASSWNPHTRSTNAGRTDEDGVWFGTAKPDNAKGALPYDTYLIEEQRCEANEGLVLVSFTVTIARDDTVSKLGTITDKTGRIVELSKEDLTTDKELPGASLELSRLDDEEKETLVEKWVSTAAPHKIKGLEPGSYRLTETAAPEGYLVAESIDFKVTELDAYVPVVMFDEHTMVQVSKVDLTGGEEVAGATLQLLDGKGSLLTEWVSEEKPHVIDKLAPGDYTLRETLPPDGYEASQDIPITVAESGATQSFAVEDAKIPEAPVTPTPVEPTPETPETPITINTTTVVTVTEQPVVETTPTKTEKISSSTANKQPAKETTSTTSKGTVYDKTGGVLGPFTEVIVGFAALGLLGAVAGLMLRAHRIRGQARSYGHDGRQGRRPKRDYRRLRF